MRRLIASSTILALAAAGGILTASVGGATAATDTAGKTPTSFAFKASGYGTDVKGGQVSAGSQGTAFQAFGCTNMAGIDKDNYVAEVELPGAGTAQGVGTRLWTAQSKKGVTSTYATSRTASVELGESPLGSVVLTAISSKTRTWHDDDGFHSSAVSTIGGITFTPTGAPAQDIPVPAPGQSVTIPGVATISLGAGRTQVNADSAKAITDGVRIDVIPTDTTVKVAHARAILEQGVKSGLMHGHASGAHASALTDYARIGQTPLSLMPCRGTDGKERSKSIASVDLGNNAVISGLTTREMGKQTADSAKGYELSKVDTVTLGAHDLVIKGVIGRANVLMSGGKVSSSTDGTETGMVSFQGEPQEFPANGDPLVIDGVATIEPNIVEQTNHGISVIALQVTLLDGSGLVLDLGEAELGIKPAKG